MIEVIVILYMIISVIIMLNILIAMLNSTYENIQGNSDLEWKFSRAVLLRVSALKFDGPDNNRRCIIIEDLGFLEGAVSIH